MLRIPGDVRKFRRRRIVAFIPTCNCERAVTTSHISVTDGASAIGVAVASITGVTPGEGRGVEEIAGVLVVRGVIVWAGEEVAVEVEIDGAAVDVD